MYKIGIDLGGTTIKGIIMNDNGEIVFQHYLPTQSQNDTLWKNDVLELFNLLKSKCKNNEINVVGLSAPGLPNSKNSCIEYLPNRLPGLENFNWTELLEIPTFVLNDAQAATLAEKKFGVAKPFKNFVLLTLGTGVGGGIFINNELYQGAGQMAGHFGHISVNPTNNVKSLLGMPGSLEYEIGNYSVAERTGGKYSSTWELVKDFEDNNYFASWVWLNSVRNLALAIASINNSLSPEAVVLAGGITLAGESLFKPLSDFLKEYEFVPHTKKTHVLQAHFGDNAGAIGAAGFAIDKLNNKY